MVTSSAVVTTVAGLAGSCSYADGTGTNARFNNIEFLTVGWDGNVYVADWKNYRVRKIAAGVVTTYAGSGTAGYIDGTGTNAAFNNLGGIVGDPSFNLYVVEYSLHLIRKISPLGAVTTLAGSGTAGYADGIGNMAQFSNPAGIAVDTSGDVYVTTCVGHSIRKITPGGSVTTFAGSTTGVSGYADGIGTNARFTCNANYCLIDIDYKSNTLYVLERGAGRIRRIAANGGVSTIAGTGSSGSSDGIGTSASFNSPDGIVFAGNVLYIADTGNHKIRSIAIGGVPAGMYQLQTLSTLV